MSDTGPSLWDMPYVLAKGDDWMEYQIEQAMEHAYQAGVEEERKRIASMNGMRTSRKTTDTQKKAVALTMPRSGTRLLTIYNLISESNGLTDFQIEETTGLAHQSASAARNNLMQRGLVTDSGLRRKNRRGHDAIVWIAVPRDRSTDVRFSPTSSSNDDQRLLA